MPTTPNRPLKATNAIPKGTRDASSGQEGGNIKEADKDQKIHVQPNNFEGESSERELRRTSYNEAVPSQSSSQYDIARLSPLYSRRSQQANRKKPPPPNKNDRPLCRFFVLQNGHCRYGDDCINSHTLPEGVTSLAQAQKEIPCPFFLRGNCKYGDYCHLRHDEQDLPLSSQPIMMAPRGVGQRITSDDEQQERGAAAATTTTISDHGVLLCGICLENPASKGSQNLVC